MTGKSAPKRIGLFGGTFDPVHQGHLSVARQLRTGLQLDELRMMLAANPPLRNAPGATADQRWRMLELALERNPELVGDDRELGRPGVSYSYDSVAEVREELGQDARIALCMGWDSLVSLPRWHRWRDLIELCALVAVNRPHHDEGRTALHPLLSRRIRPAGNIPELQAGEVLEVELPPSSVSATGIRNAIAAGETVPEGWLTEEVAGYIKQNQLYGMQ